MKSWSSDDLDKEVRQEEMRIERCPVCQVKLGDRLLREQLKKHCKECRATFTFKPFLYCPEALTDQQERSQCHCPACQERRKKPS